MLEWGKSEKSELDYNKFIEESYKFFSEYENLIFKGASLLEIININKINDVKIQRATKDIDITNISYDKETIIKITNKFIKNLSQKYDLNEFNIKENEKTKNSDVFYTLDFISKIDGQIRFNIDFSKDYYYWQDKDYKINSIEFKGYDINKIIADKLTVISSRKVFSRIKDFVDLYNITLNKDYTIETNRIKEYIKYKKHDNMSDEFGEFVQILTMKDNIYKCITKMVGLEPSFISEDNFNKIYDRMIKFCMPFIYNTSNNCIWDSEKGRWI